MLLEIDDGKTLGDLQENFNESFPYLKIQFYDRKYRGIKELHLLFPLMPDVLVAQYAKNMIRAFILLNHGIRWVKWKMTFGKYLA